MIVASNASIAVETVLRAHRLHDETDVAQLRTVSERLRRRRRFFAIRLDQRAIPFDLREKGRVVGFRGKTISDNYFRVVASHETRVHVARNEVERDRKKN